MARAIDAFAIVLFLSAAVSFVYGIRALGERDDFTAVYLLVVGALALRASTEILRPKSGG